jgi:hypothetical protein
MIILVKIPEINYDCILIFFPQYIDKISLLILFVKRPQLVRKSTFLISNLITKKPSTEDFFKLVDYSRTSWNQIMQELRVWEGLRAELEIGCKY